MNRLARRALVAVGVVVLMLIAGLVIVRQTNSPVVAQEAERLAAAGEERMSTGRTVFLDNCAGCHGLGGGGRIGPALAGNDNLERQDYVTGLILRGGDGMPAFHDRLGEAEIIAVSQYIRNAWENDFGPVEPELLVRQWWRGAQDTAELYQRVCARCHGQDGGGFSAPALAGNENLADAQYVAGKILHGQGGMPAFEGLLDAQAVTALASFIRTDFGNEFGPVEVETVLGLQNVPGRRGPSRLEATVIPSDARLAVLGPDRFVRFSTDAGRLLLHDLPVGRYSIVASREGYQSVSTELDLSPGGGSRISFILQPFGLSGSFEVRSEPLSSGAKGDEQPHLFHLTMTELTTDAAEGEAGDAPGVMTNLQAYLSTCALCHGPSGEGGVGPGLAGNQRLRDEVFVLDRILHGAGRMPAFGHRLSDKQISAIATHERTAWGNGFGQVTAEQVASQRREPESQELASPALASGTYLYLQNCSVCHGNQGAGSNMAPALRANPDLLDPAYTISRIVMGSGGMPAFGDDFSSAEIAAVASFVRTAWGNDFGPVSIPQAQNYHFGASSLAQ